MVRLLIGICLGTVLAGGAHGALIVNTAKPITEVVTLQPVIVANDDGSNASTFFGSLAQQTAIVNLIDQIWAQAGIDIEWLAPHNWNNTLANYGSAPPTVVRSSADLGAVVEKGDAAGVGSADPLVLDIYFLRVVPAFAEVGPNTAAGFAFVGWNGITAFVGENLLTFDAGLELIAAVMAHEIGHNLGLGHIVEGENLMQSVVAGQRLNLTQATTALNSSFSVPITAVPEPGGWMLVALALLRIRFARRAASSVRPTRS